MSSAPATSITYASAGLLIGKPGARMMPGFPKDTTFSPYLALRNTSEKPLDVSLQLNYMSGSMKDTNGGAPVTRNLPAQHLGPFEAEQVNMQAALHSAGLAVNCLRVVAQAFRPEESASCFNSSINLSVSFTGKAGNLVLASGSVDQTGTYVFEVDPQGIGSTRSKYTNYWGVANGNDTMFSLLNPTNAAQDILATFYYADGSGKYTLPVHLEAQASTIINMAMLIAEHQPDADGNVIPSNIQEGSAQFASAKGRQESISLVIVGGIYNVATATCGSSCITCCGDSNFGITPNPIYCPIGGSSPCGSTAVDCNGSGVSPISWSSSNTAVMTVNSSGIVTGVSVGSATITANFGNVVINTGSICAPSPSCSYNSPAPQVPAIVLRLSLSPTQVNMSSGDANVTIQLTISPSTASVLPAFTSGLSSNPNSSSTASISIQNPSNNVSASYNAPITASGTNSPSGLFTVLAAANGVTSNTANLEIPPQVLIQVLYGEAHGQAAIGDTVSEPAVGSSIKDRFGHSEFPGGSVSTYQAVIVSSQYNGINTSITTGVEPELDVAVSLFNGTQGDTVAGSPCLFSPTASGWASIQAALNSGTTTVPNVTNDPQCYGSNRQLVYKSSIGNNANGNGAPAFIFERQKSSSSNPAVVQIQ